MAYAGSTPWYVRQESRGIVHGGMLGGAGLGRHDDLPISVPSGSHVIPADVVAGIFSTGKSSIYARTSAC
jgi:hypothetical protein